ncbi:hypothetical protein ACOZFD_004980, partial [Escherichia coli]
YGPQNDVTLKMPAFEWVHVQLHQQKGMISLSPPTICNSAQILPSVIKRDSSSLNNKKDNVFIFPPEKTHSKLCTKVSFSAP